MKNYKRLSLDEREEISRMLSQNCSLNDIAKSLSRYASTITREVRLGKTVINIPTGPAKRNGELPETLKIALESRVGWHYTQD